MCFRDTIPTPFLCSGTTAAFGAFGANGSGQLGDGTLESKVITRPVFGTKGLPLRDKEYESSSLNAIAAVKVMEGVKDVSAGMDYTLILKQDGTLWGLR